MPEFFNIDARLSGLGPTASASNHPAEIGLTINRRHLIPCTPRRPRGYTADANGASIRLSPSASEATATDRIVWDFEPGMSTLP